MEWKIAHCGCFFTSKFENGPRTFRDFLGDLRFLPRFGIEIGDTRIGVPHPKSFDFAKDPVLAEPRQAETAEAMKHLLRDLELLLQDRMQISAQNILLSKRLRVSGFEVEAFHAVSDECLEQARKFATRETRP